MGDNGLFRKAREAINAYKEAEKNESDILREIEKELNVLRIGNVYTDDMIGQKITYSANGQSDWIIFGRGSNGSILITTESPIENNHKIVGTLESYLNYESELDEACSVYGKEIQGRTLKSRSIKLEDINYVSGFIEPEFEVYTFAPESDYANKKVDYYYPKLGASSNGKANWMKATNDEETVEIKYNGYRYYYSGGKAVLMNSEDFDEREITTPLNEERMKYIWGEDENLYYYMVQNVFTRVSVKESDQTAYWGTAVVGKKTVNSFSYTRCYSNNNRGI